MYTDFYRYLEACTVCPECHLEIRLLIDAQNCDPPTGETSVVPLSGVMDIIYDPKGLLSGQKAQVKRLR